MFIIKPKSVKEMLTQSVKERFRHKIFRFYKEQGRTLPWRQTTNRYHIMVSEIMLQQTQVDRVIPKYNAWIAKFPTIDSLATSSLADVLQMWSGLGYNSRAKRLQECAKKIMKEYNGVVPRAVEELLKLPGIGPYTARSILIFADNVNVATVDTNIRRIFMYEFKLDSQIGDKELFNIAQEILPIGKSKDWHNALMDYGSIVLTSKKTGIKPKTKQSKFLYSKRWYRGKIIKMLTEEKKVSKEAMKKSFDNPKYSVQEIMDKLVEEGLVACEKEEYFIA